MEAKFASICLTLYKKDEATPEVIDIIILIFSRSRALEASRRFKIFIVPQLRWGANVGVEYPCFFLPSTRSSCQLYLRCIPSQYGRSNVNTDLRLGRGTDLINSIESDILLSPFLECLREQYGRRINCPPFWEETFDSVARQRRIGPRQ